jgi:hypothetical protein
MLLLWVLVVMRLKLGQRLLVRLWPRNLGRVWEVRVKLGGGGRKIVGISLTRHRLRALVDDDDMTLFKVLD